MLLLHISMVPFWWYNEYIRGYPASISFNMVSKYQISRWVISFVIRLDHLNCLCLYVYYKKKLTCSSVFLFCILNQNVLIVIFLYTLPYNRSIVTRCFIYFALKYKLQTFDHRFWKPFVLELIFYSHPPQLCAKTVFSLSLLPVGLVHFCYWVAALGIIRLKTKLFQHSSLPACFYICSLLSPYALKLLSKRLWP